ncbi:MAG: histidine kinase dimerization/phospho-acceptor domain-containing protein, partial [Acidimicrobiia bacterium]
MNDAPTVLSLGADLAVSLAMASLVAMVARRTDLLGLPLWARTVLAPGAALLAATALARGARLQPALESDVLLILEGFAVIGFAIGAAVTRGPRVPLLAAALLVATGTVAANNGLPVVAGLSRFAGGVTVGGALWLAASNSLTTRIAVAAGALIVAVVLALSGSLSAILTRTVADEALRRAGGRARTEAELIEATADDAARQAGFLAKLIGASRAGGTATTEGDADEVANIIQRLKAEGLAPVDFFAVVGPNGRVLGDDDGLAPAELASVTGTKVVQEALPPAPTDGGSLEVVDSDSIVAVGAGRIRALVQGREEYRGAVVAGFRLDEQFLRTRAREGGERNELTLATADRVLASSLSRPPTNPDELLLDSSGLVSRALRQGAFQREGKTRGGNVYLGARPVRASDGSRIAAILVTLDGALVAEARNSLFTTLFLVALGASAVSLALAAGAGSRLGAPLRRLTTAAEHIRRGDLSVRAGLRTKDEIGVLGRSFDQMAASVERLAGELRSSAAQIEAVLRSMAEGVVATDQVGLVVMVNPAAERLLGVRSAREAGRPVATVIRGRDRAGLPFSERLELPSFEAWSLSGFLDHETTPVAVSGAPIRAEAGGVLGAVYVIRDMRREYEVERLKTEFLSNISHELRTPLTPVRGYAEMLRTRDVPPARANEMLDEILASSERLQRVIDILLNFSAMEAGRLELRAETIDLAPFLHQICVRWDSRSDRHHVDEQVTGHPRIVADRR